jgi:hypothetical protein
MAHWQEINILYINGLRRIGADAGGRWRSGGTRVDRPRSNNIFVIASPGRGAHHRGGNPRHPKCLGEATFTRRDGQQFHQPVSPALRSKENTAIYLDIARRQAMSNSAQKRAIENYRSRLTERGIARFEIQALDADRDLLRSLARKLTEDGPEAGQLRRTIQQAVAGEPPKAGGLLAALRRSPLVDADIDLSRPREKGRKVDL